MTGGGTWYSHWRISDYRRSYTTLDAVRGLAAASGVFSVTNDHLIDDDFTDTDNWGTLSAGSEVHVPGTSLSITGRGVRISNIEGGRQGRLRVTTASDNGLLMWAASGAGNAFAVSWNDSELIHYSVVDGEWTQLRVLGDVRWFSSADNIELVWEVIEYDLISTWTIATLYINDHFVWSMYDEVDPNDMPDWFVGIGADTGETAVYTSVVLENFAERTQFWSIPVNGTPSTEFSSIIQRNMHGAYNRYDGSIRLTKYEADRTVVHTFDEGDDYAYGMQINNNAVITHLRVMGGQFYADYIDNALTREYDYQFMEVQNPNVLTRAECTAAAYTMFRQLNQQNVKLTISAPYHPFLEPNDCVMTPHGEFIIESISVNAEGSADYSCYASDPIEHLLPVRQPTGLTLSNPSGGIKLDWTINSTDESGFSIERSTDGITYSELTQVASGVSTYTDATATEGTTYYYRIYAFRLGYGATIALVDDSSDVLIDDNSDVILGG